MKHILIYDDYNNRIKADQRVIGTLTHNCGLKALRSGTKIIEWEDEDMDKPINTMPDGTCRTIKRQYQQTSRANLERQGTFGATGCINPDTRRIRKLTPKECWRLMGFDDEDVDKASKLNSNTQLYKQAGNSICVPVLEAIFKNLYRKETYSV